MGGDDELAAARPPEAVMSGHGYYNRHSVLQAAAAELGIAALERAAAVVPVAVPPQPIVVADYGCSQGQNSLRPMTTAVHALRARTSDAITVLHTDLPANDFSSLFEAVAHDPSSYVVTDDNTYALAAGRSFYDEVVSPGSVALGWSAITTHWLSEMPAPVPGHVMAQVTADAATRDVFAAQAEADWRGFLTARAAELVPGGRLVMVEPCAHPNGTIGSERLMGVMDEALRELVDAGRVDPEAAAACTLPMWMRTPAEYETQVDEHPHLRLVSSQLVEALPSPLWTRFEADGDAASYAQASIGSMRAWSEAMVAEALTDADTLDEFYARCLALGQADPERLHLRVFHLVLDIEHT